MKNMLDTNIGICFCIDTQMSNDTNTMIICKHKQSNIDVDVDMEVSENGVVTPKQLVYNGKPQSKMDDLGVSPFQEPPYNVVPPSYKLVYRFLSPSRYIYHKAQ